MISQAKTYIDVQAPVPFQGGILSVANVIPATGHSLLGAEYQSDACADGATWTDICYSLMRDFCVNDGDDPDDDPAEPEGGYKTFDGEPELVEGSPFAVYAGIECKGTQGSEERAVQRLSYAEGRQIDQAVTAQLEATMSSDLGSMSMLEAIMAFEDAAAAGYGGYPTIVMPRSSVVCAMAQRLVFPGPDNVLMTANGTRVANTAQSTPGLDNNIYLTGQITLIQGEVMSHVVPSVTRPDGTCDPERALAERMYVPLVECLVVGATAECDPTP